ncbi:MAG TPA: hypothetical protein VE505_13845 [Vicinamibacterales bacterium]|nr:hypothetical protein [Vicinamibacterales bacterium]
MITATGASGVNVSLARAKWPKDENHTASRVIGLAASRVTNELVLSNVVLGSSETDSTLSVVAAVAVIAVVGLAACLIPARRASRISPMTALRQDCP